MPKYSGGSIKTALSNLSSSRGAYISKGLDKIFRGKISHPVFGTQKVSDALKKPSIDKKTLIEIYKKAREAKGVLRETSGKSENEFIKQVTKQQRIDKQLDQKNQDTAQKTIKPKNEKVLNIVQAQKETAKAERWRGAALGGEKAIRGMERVYAGGKDYRKQQAATSGLLKSRGGGGMAAEGRSGGLADHAVKEEEKDEKNSPKGSKSGQKGGGSAPAGQKSGGNQPPKLQGSAGFEKLTRSPETSSDKNIPTGGIRVKELENKPPASQPEISPAPRSASAPEITDLDIG